MVSQNPCSQANSSISAQDVQSHGSNGTVSFSESVGQNRSGLESVSCDSTSAGCNLSQVEVSATRSESVCQNQLGSVSDHHLSGDASKSSIQN